MISLNWHITVETLAAKRSVISNFSEKQWQTAICFQAG